MKTAIVNLTGESNEYCENILQSNSSGLYKRLVNSRVAKERRAPVSVVGAALVGDDERPYFALKCGYDWILVAIDERGRVSQSDMAGLVSRRGALEDAVSRHNDDYITTFKIDYMEIWEETA